MELSKETGSGLPACKQANGMDAQPERAVPVLRNFHQAVTAMDGMTGIA